MARFDFSKHDVNVTLSIDRRLGIWAASTTPRANPTTRQAARLESTDMSASNLYSIALVAAVRSIGLNQRTYLTKGENRKVKVLVAIEDSPSAHEFAAGIKDVKQSRVSGAFRKELNRQISKFDLEFSFESAAGYVGVLDRWAQTTVAPLPDSSPIPKVFQRQAIAQVISSR